MSYHVYTCPGCGGEACARNTGAIKNFHGAACPACGTKVSPEATFRRVEGDFDRDMLETVSRGGIVADRDGNPDPTMDTHARRLRGVRKLAEAMGYDFGEILDEAMGRVEAEPRGNADFKPTNLDGIRGLRDLMNMAVPTDERN